MERRWKGDGKAIRLTIAIVDILDSVFSLTTSRQATVLVDTGEVQTSKATSHHFLAEFTCL